MIRDQIIVHAPFDAVRASALQKCQPTLEDVLMVAETYETTTKTVAAFIKSVFKKDPINAIHTYTRKPLLGGGESDPTKVH